MDRRLVVILGFALAAVVMAPALAQVGERRAVPPSPAAPPPPSQGPIPVPVEPVPEIPPPVEAPPTVAGPAPVVVGEVPAPRDDEVVRVADGPGSPNDPFILPIEGLPIGSQSVSLTVEVQSDPVAFLNKEITVKIVVKNTGTTDARSVMVRDVLPDGLEFLEGLPPQAPERNGQMLSWTLNSLPAGTEKVLKVRVKPTRVGPLDHAATVSLSTAARSRTVVQQPRLRVEQVASTTKVLKGQQVQFKITVSNPGTGTARNVLVQARLSGGLRHEQNSRSLDLTLPEVRPNETITLTPLVLDTVAGGMQTCEVLVSSPDVVPGPEDEQAQSARSEVEVLEPMLNLTIQGPERGYTRKTVSYHLLVENPGTAPIQNVQIAIYVPEGGELTAKPSGSRYTSNDRNLRLMIPRVEPKERADYEFRVQLGGVGLFKLAAAAKAPTSDRPLESSAVYTTDIQGMADVRVKAVERNRIHDVGDIVEFEISLENMGTKEASQVVLSAELTSNLKIEETDHEGEEQAKFDPKTGRLLFPTISRMAPGGQQRLLIRARALEPGVAKCHLYLLFDNEPEPIPFIAYTRIETLSSPRRN